MNAKRNNERSVCVSTYRAVFARSLVARSTDPAAAPAVFVRDPLPAARAPALPGARRGRRSRMGAKP